MNRFRALGYIKYNGRIQVNKSLLNVVLLDQLPEHNSLKPALPSIATILKPVVPIVAKIVKPVVPIIETILKPVVPIIAAIKRKLEVETPPIEGR
jgi:hypothetical protein